MDKKKLTKNETLIKLLMNISKNGAEKEEYVNRIVFEDQTEPAKTSEVDE